MKTIEDLRALFPTFLKEILASEIDRGETYVEFDEDGCGLCETNGENMYVYDKGNWNVEIYFDVHGRLVEDEGDRYTSPYSWYEDTKLVGYSASASYYDEETGDAADFEVSDMEEFFKMLGEEIAQL